MRACVSAGNRALRKWWNLVQRPGEMFFKVYPVACHTVPLLWHWWRREFSDGPSSAGSPFDLAPVRFASNRIKFRKLASLAAWAFKVETRRLDLECGYGVVADWAINIAHFVLGGRHLRRRSLHSQFVCWEMSDVPVLGLAKLGLRPSDSRPLPEYSRCKRKMSSTIRKNY